MLSSGGCADAFVIHCYYSFGSVSYFFFCIMRESGVFISLAIRSHFWSDSRYCYTFFCCCCCYHFIIFIIDIEIFQSRIMLSVFICAFFLFVTIFAFAKHVLYYWFGDESSSSSLRRDKYVYISIIKNWVIRWERERESEKKKLVCETL